jgi:uncharacterized protein (TIGR02452 family)
MSAILEETLELTKDGWGTATVMDFTGVTGIPWLPGEPAVEVTSETVQDAALRFRGWRATVLNFASGVQPGGGVRFGAVAQEEVLCLSSGLLYGLEGFPAFYMKNREEDAPPECYDLMIWSEGVPLIRNGKLELVEPMTINVITYPAPNMYRRVYAGSGTFSEERMSDEWSREVFARRTRHVVRRAAKADTEVLVLGAWGCGAYANDPTMVAKAFRDAIVTQSGGIERVVFAVYGRGQIGRANRKAFERVLG